MARFPLADAIDAVSGSSDNRDADCECDSEEGVPEAVVVEEDLVVDEEVDGARDDGNPKEEHE